MSFSLRKLCSSRSFIQLASLRSIKTTSSTTNAAQPIPAPAADNVDKVYPANIQNIVAEISKLTLIEVADLNELLKKTLKIDDSQLISHVAGPAAAGAKKTEEAEQAKETRTSFTVKLVKVDDTKKVAAIKAVKGLIEGMNLVQAKKFVESAPQVIRADIGKEEADKIKKILEEGGAVVEIV